MNHVHTPNPFRVRSGRLLSLRRFALTLGLLASLTACGGSDGASPVDNDSPDAADTTAAPPQSDAAALQVVASDLAFDPTELTASAGQVTIELVNEGALQHDVVIEEAGDARVAAADGGQTETGTVELEAGSYTFYCSVAGHRDAGMEGTLTVR